MAPDEGVLRPGCVNAGAAEGKRQRRAVRAAIDNGRVRKETGRAAKSMEGT
jgi:hypothetical protein